MRSEDTSLKEAVKNIRLRVTYLRICVTVRKPDSYRFSRFGNREEEYHTLKHRLHAVCTDFGGGFWDFRGDMGRAMGFPGEGPYFGISAFAGELENSELGFSFLDLNNPSLSLSSFALIVSGYY